MGVMIRIIDGVFSIPVADGANTLTWDILEGRIVIGEEEKVLIKDLCGKLNTPIFLSRRVFK